jgi:hypothetical protein
VEPKQMNALEQVQELLPEMTFEEKMRTFRFQLLRSSDGWVMTSLPSRRLARPIKNIKTRRCWHLLMQIKELY